MYSRHQQPDLNVLNQLHGRHRGLQDYRLPNRYRLPSTFLPSISPAGRHPAPKRRSRTSANCIRCRFVGNVEVSRAQVWQRNGKPWMQKINAPRPIGTTIRRTMVTTTSTSQFYINSRGYSLWLGLCVHEAGYSGSFSSRQSFQSCSLLLKKYSGGQRLHRCLWGNWTGMFWSRRYELGI